MIILTTSLTLIALCFSSPSLAKNKKHHNYNEHFDYAKVVEASPIFETVSYTYPEEYCRIEKVKVKNHRDSSTAMILGGIIGGVIGNELGHNRHDKKVRTIAGALLGGSIAKDIKHKKHGYHYTNEEVCTRSNRIEYKKELVGYDVTYRYHGKLYTTITEQHPGKRIQVATSVRPVTGLKQNRR